MNSYSATVKLEMTVFCERILRDPALLPREQMAPVLLPREPMAPALLPREPVLVLLKKTYSWRFARYLKDTNEVTPMGQ
jgi:hypothetical protein